MAGAQSTKLKILDAAELLFAQNGFSETSLRQITNKAEVNLASVNYHFGSKKELIQAVLERYLKMMVPGIMDKLMTLKHSDSNPDLTQVLAAFIEPILALNHQKKDGTTILLKLMGRGYTDAQGHLRWFIATNYGEVMQLFVGLIQQVHPTLTASDIFWRLHFTLGSIVFTMASSEALMDIASNDFKEDMDIAGVIHHLIPFIAAGIAAPSSSKKI
jgi:AcrR family transcriptional regulator